MTTQQFEDLYIRSLDDSITKIESEQLAAAVLEDPDLSISFRQHQKVRELLKSQPASFGPYFAMRVINTIRNTGTAIDNLLFGLFRKYQLAFAGIVVALAVLNVVLTDEFSISSIFGFDTSSTDTVADTEPPFDLSKLFDAIK